MLRFCQYPEMRELLFIFKKSVELNRGKDNFRESFVIWSWINVIFSSPLKIVKTNVLFFFAITNLKGSREFSFNCKLPDQLPFLSRGKQFWPVTWSVIRKKKQHLKKLNMYFCFWNSKNNAFLSVTLSLMQPFLKNTSLCK